VAVGKHKDHKVVDVKDVAGGVRNGLNLVNQTAGKLLLSIEKREKELDHDEKGTVVLKFTN
jgi:predicted thioredoxin/glutaredoxin